MRHRADTRWVYYWATWAVIILAMIVLTLVLVYGVAQ